MWALEIEAKIAVADHQPLRAALTACAAVACGTVLECNTLFDDAAQHLMKKGCGLRIREVTILDGPPRSSTLTFKGPLAAGDLKIRPEHETAVEDASAATELLHGLGYDPHLRFEKRRETWTLDGCTVELDTVPVLGNFVEVEGPNENAVIAVLARLGLSAAPRLTTSYVAMLADAAGGAEAPIEFRFPSPPPPT